MGSTSVWEIEEETPNGLAVSEPRRSLSGNVPAGDDVYVAVGRRSSSVGALSWALAHVVTPSSFVYLIHVFPEVHHIPTPLGLVPKDQVSQQQVEIYVGQQRQKRREMLQKLLNLCHASKVKADTLLIESDLTAKAVVDLISVLNIRRLIVGTTKSNLRSNLFRKWRKGSSKAEQIHGSAPQYCKVTIICDGKEATDIDRTVPSSLSQLTSKSNKQEKRKRKNRNIISCHCFSPKFM